MFQHPLAPFAQQGQVDAEAGVGGFGAGDRLEQQIDRRAAVERGELRRDVGQAAVLRGGAGGGDQAVEPAQDGGHRVDRLDGRVDADHGVAAAEQQSVDRRQQDAAQVVGRMVGLQRACPARRAGPSCCGSA